jgi:DNA-binding response OmpR family regulator
LPVFILTASGSSDAATEGVRLLVSKFLEKPISMPSLLATIRKFLEEFYGAA